MNRSVRDRLQSMLVLGMLLSGTLAGCAPATTESTMEASGGTASNQMEMSGRAPMDMAAAPAADVAQSVSEAVAEVPKAAPQLIKTANMTLTVDSVEQSLERIRAIAQQQQGDIIGLQNQNPADPSVRHIATIQLRIPQAQLDATLKALSDVGTVQQQSISASDVSTQLVDFEARLRNLRQTEEMLLGIMRRSGGMTDVLQVARELSTIRNSIEQTAAQLNSLKTQVAYSTVNLQIEQAIASIPPQTPLNTQLQDSWEQATHAVGELTTGLLKLGLWLVAFSPYWIVLSVGAAAIYLRTRRPSPLSDEPTEPPATAN
ncbi:DUF4349 domain-containing protein [Leptolyngbya sp. AN02str]|uniref:DUF4349 domain-containing protein n=1 Tax=Leptolyngbya sp. AN02str TaxID=3423363 RepID=UPI003D311326